ncbi:MAG: ABC transporter permease subunit [Spiroplasma sp.]
MINFRFVKSQFKNVRPLIIIFFFIVLILLIPALSQDYFAPSATIHKTSSSTSISSYLGAGTILINVFFGVPGFVVLLAFSIILIHILITKEVDRGYFASWLTTPMSRKTILNSKFFVLVSSILIVYGAILLLQIILFPVTYKDFNSLVLGNILLYNFAFILLALFWTSINWFIMCLFNKGAIAISVASTVSIFFIVCTILAMLSSIPSLKSLKYFKYLTIISLFNSPFTFGSIPHITDDFNGTISAEIFGAKVLDFAWQLPVMFVLPFGFFILGNCFFIKKDLQL